MRRNALAAIVLFLCLADLARAQFTPVANTTTDILYSQGKVGVGPSAPQAQLDLADIYTAGGKNLLIGNDAFFSDIDIANVLGLYGNGNTAVAGLKLGGNGPVLYGKNGLLGVDADPVERLQLGDRFTFHDGGTKVLGMNFSWSGNADRRLVNAGVATLRFGAAGDLQLLTAPNGPAGSAIVYPSNGVILDSQGRFGIGGQPSAQVEIHDLYPAGGKNLLVGNDAFFTDVDDGNVLGLYGNWDNTVAGLRLGSSGPVVAGANSNLGIETRSPAARLHVAKSDAVIGEFVGASGAPLWTQTSNPTTQWDRAAAADTDADAIYVGGTAGQQGWRLEKRRKSDGALVAGFGSSGVLVDQPLAAAQITGLAVADGTLYVVGYGTPGDTQWVTEARDKVTGALLWRQVSNPSTNVSNSIYNDSATAVVVDGASVYTAGRKYGWTTSPQTVLYQWRVEKRSRATGALDPSFDGDGIAEFSLANTAGEPLAMKRDGDDLYLAGYETGWRLQRVSSSTGASVWVAGSVTTISAGNRALALAVDGSGLYAAGYEVQGVNNYQWRIEKRSKANGALIPGFGTGGVVSLPLPGLDRPTGLALDPTGLYVTGFQSPTSANSQWRTEKRDPGTGALIVGFGANGVIVDDPSAGKDEAYGVVADLSGVYLFGRDAAPANGQWRVRKLQSLDLQGFNVVSGGKVGIGTRTPGNILTIQQNSPTDPIADAWTTYSSRRWKTDIRPLAAALDTVRRLQGVSYRAKGSARQEIGLIAEEVEAVVPEVVSYEADGRDVAGLDYARLVAVLIEAVKEQQRQIDELRAALPVPRNAVATGDLIGDDAQALLREASKEGGRK